MSRWDVFVDRVHRLVRAIPRGRVVTYGQIARLAGRPRAAREVGWIAHAGGDHVPWQRVVNRWGGLATGYRGGRAGHKRALTREGVVLGPGDRVDLSAYQWWPDPSTARRLRLPLDAMAAVWTAHRAWRATRGGVPDIE
jgi:methylated-DNA-protein-cysteine methyltransferase-like protein